MSLPVRIIPPPPAMMDTATQDYLEVRGNARVRRKPTTVPEDVWSIVEELRDKGGLFDLTVQIARLESEFRSIEQLMENRDLLPAEALRVRMKLTDQIAALQAKAVDITIKTRDIITNDGLRVILNAVFDSLKLHVNDPVITNKIGQDVALALKALKSQVKT